MKHQGALCINCTDVWIGIKHTIHFKSIECATICCNEDFFPCCGYADATSCFFIESQLIAEYFYNNIVLEGFTNVDMDGDVDIRKFAIGYLYTFASATMSWVLRL